jgi:hypothetical protein
VCQWVRHAGVRGADAHLVADDENVLLPLELHDHGLEPHDDVPVRLAAAVAVVVLVVVPVRKVFRVRLLRAPSAPRRARGEARTSISSYVMPSQTPASSSSRLFHVSFVYGRSCAVRIVRWSVDVHTVSGASPMLSLMSAGSVLAYLSPRGDSAASPPILPSTLYWLSPCYRPRVSHATLMPRSTRAARARRRCCAA